MMMSNDDDDDYDDANSKDAEVVEIGNVSYVSKPEIPIKGRKELSCRHKIRIREDKSAEQKAKPYQ